MSNKLKIYQMNKTTNFFSTNYLNEVRGYAKAHGLPFYFFSDLLKAKEAYEKSKNTLKTAEWIIASIVKCENYSQLTSCENLVLAFHRLALKTNTIKEVSDICNLLQKYILERKCSFIINSIPFNYNNDSGIHPEWSSPVTDSEGAE